MEHSAEPIAAKGGRNVLVIDDEPEICDVLSALIEHAGYPVTASSKLDGVDLTRLGESDIVFLDMMMPGKDGIQVLQAFSRGRVKSSIVLMSGQHADILTTAQRIGKELGLRVSGVLRKPFHHRDLHEFLGERPEKPNGSARGPRSSEIALPDVIEGLARQEFDTYLQPMIDLTTGRPVAYEALARWRSERFDMVSPERFTEIAAQNGLLPRLTQQIANRALQYAAKLKKRGLVWKVYINLRAEDLLDNSLPEKLAELVDGHRLPQHSLTVEITESSASTQHTKMLETLARMRLKGIDLAIDDFGSSYCCLERLSIIPFVALKIDGRFVSEIVANNNARAVVHSSIMLAKRLNIGTVAEGIETEDQLDAVRKLGCDYGQGYYLAAPLQFAEVLEWASSFGVLAN